VLNSVIQRSGDAPAASEAVAGIGFPAVGSLVMKNRFVNAGNAQQDVLGSWFRS
jgi:hypothetical protein